jgi:biotin carboxyl carrier protein
MSLSSSQASIASFLLAAGLLAGGPSATARGTPPEEKGPRLVHIPAGHDGTISAVAVEVAPGEKVPADRLFAATFVYLTVRLGEKEKVSADQVIELAKGERWRLLREGEVPEAGRVRVHSVKKDLKLLRPGDTVKAGQCVALMDPTLAVKELRDKVAVLETSEAERKAATKTREEAERRVTAMESQMRRSPSTSKDDYEGAKLTARRYFEEEVAKKAAVAKAQQQLLRAVAAVRSYEARAPVPGVIRSVDKRQGDAVKAGETVLTLETPRGERR